MVTLNIGLFISADFWLKSWAVQDTQTQRQFYYPGYYILFCLATTGFAIARAILFFRASIRANTFLHDTALKRVFKAPLSFFSGNPIGRTLNRFSADVGQIDELLPISLFDTLQMTFMVLGALVVVCIAIPWMIMSVPFIVWILWSVRNYATKSLRELKRLDGMTRSPFFNAFSASRDGLTSIRAFGRQDNVHKFFLELVETNSKCWFCWLLVSRWLGFRLDILSTLIVAFSVVLGGVLRSQINSGSLGLAIVYSISLSGLFQYGKLRLYSIFEENIFCGSYFII